MKATREQVQAMMRQAAKSHPDYDPVLDTDEAFAEVKDDPGNAFFEALVHLAQQFTLDQLRAHGAVAIVHERVGIKPLGTGPFVQHGDSLYRIPETLE